MSNDDAPRSDSPVDDANEATEAVDQTAPEQQIDEAPSAAPDAAPAPAGAAVVNQRGRPILGAIAGFLLGAFVWIDLVLFGVIAFESVSVWFFPIVGLIAGIALAMWAPFGRRRAAT